MFRHDLMHVTVSIECVCRWQAAEHISSEGAGRDYWAAWFGSSSNWWQLVSRCGGVCVARTRRPIPTSLVHVQHALAEVAVCVALEPHGLGEGGSKSNACVMVVACASYCGRSGGGKAVRYVD